MERKKKKKAAAGAAVKCVVIYTLERRGSNDSVVVEGTRNRGDRKGERRGEVVLTQATDQ